MDKQALKKEIHEVLKRHLDKNLFCGSKSDIRDVYEAHGVIYEVEREMNRVSNNMFVSSNPELNL